MSTHTVTINGIELVYEKEGSGPAVVFLHGGNVSGIEWEAVVPHLLSNYTCYVLDQRGHGRSGRDPNVDYSFRAFAAEAAEFLDKVSGPAVIVGHSQGGHAAFGVAAARPDLVRGIYSEDAIPAIGTAAVLSSTWVMRMFPAMGALAVRREREAMSVLEFAAAWGDLAPAGTRFSEQLPPATVIASARASYGTDPNWYSFAVDCDRFGWAESEVQRLTDASCPVHLARGNPRMGGLVSDDALAAVERRAGWTTTYFEGAGHNIQSVLPREYIDDLKAFLATVPA